MSNPKKRNLLEDVIDGTRRLLEELDRTLNPKKHDEERPVPVPIPVRPDRRHPDDGRYR